MAYGLKTSAKDRAAVQDFRSRGVKTWKELGQQLNQNQNHCTSKTTKDQEREKEEEERNLEIIAQLNIDLLRAEAASDDPCLETNEREQQFLESTKRTLEGLINLENVAFNNQTNGENTRHSIIHNHREIQPLISEVLEKIHPNYQDQQTNLEEYGDSTG
jgi:hypothetical protein